MLKGVIPVYKQISVYFQRNQVKQAEELSVAIVNIHKSVTLLANVDFLLYFPFFNLFFTHTSIRPLHSMFVAGSPSFLALETKQNIDFLSLSICHPQTCTAAVFCHCLSPLPHLRLTSEKMSLSIYTTWSTTSQPVHGHRASSLAKNRPNIQLVFARGWSHCTPS